MSTISWIGQYGTWSTAANWAGGAVPGAADDVVLAGRYDFALLDSSATVSSVTIARRAAGVRVTGSGTLDVTGTLSLGGRLILDSGATLKDATVAITGKGRASVASGVTFDHVTWQSPFSLDGTLTIAGETRFTGAGGVGAGTLTIGRGAWLNVHQAVLDNVTVSVGSTLTSSDIAVQYLTPGGTLLLGAGFTLNVTGYCQLSDGGGTGTIVNAGTITVEGAPKQSARLVDTAAHLVNQGLITIDNGLFDSTGLVNAGTIEVGARGTLGLGDGAVLTVNRGAVSGLGDLRLSQTAVLDFGAGATLTGLYTAASPNVTFSGGTLANAIWQGTLALDAYQAATIAGVRFEGPGNIGRGAISLDTETTLTVQQAALDNATLTVRNFNPTGFTNGAWLRNAAAGGTLTLGARFTILATDRAATLSIGTGAAPATVVNQGTIVVGASNGATITGGRVSVSDRLINLGAVQVAAGEFLAGGALTNLGTIAISATGTIGFGGGNAVTLVNGTISGFGNLSLAAGATLALHDGATLSGTRTSMGPAISAQGGTLTNLVWQGPWTQATGVFHIGSGVVFTGADGTGRGVINGSNAGIGIYVAAPVLDNLALTTNGTRNQLAAEYAAPGGTITLGRNFTLTVRGSQNINSGSQTGTVVNAGTIAVNSGASITDYATSFVNAGTLGISALAAGFFTQNDFTNSGTVSVASSQLSVGGRFSNTGSVVLTGGTLAVGTGTVLGLAGATVTGLGRFSADASSRITVLAGAVVSGTRTASTPNILFSGGTLSGATWQGTLALDRGGIVLDGAQFTGVGGTGQGALAPTAGFATIDIRQAVLDNVAVGASYGGTLLADYAAEGGTLTFGPNTSIALNAQKILEGSRHGTVVNAGTITTVAGGSQESATNFVNAGTIAIGSGSALVINGNFSNTGLISLAAGSGLLINHDATLSLSGGTGSVTGPGTIALSGNSLTGTPIGATLTGTRVAGGPNVVLSGGTLANLLWQGTLALGNIDFGYFRNVTFAGESGTGQGTLAVNTAFDPFSYNTRLVFGQSALDNVTVAVTAQQGLTMRLDFGAIGGTFTLGAGAAIASTTGVLVTDYLTGSGSFINAGTISGGVTFDVDRIVNAGTLLTGASAIRLGLYGRRSTFSNTGSIGVGTGGSLLTLAADSVNGGTIAVAGTLALGLAFSSATTATSTGFINTGTISVHGGLLSLGGSYLAPNSFTFTNSGYLGFDAATFQFGTLTNQSVSFVNTGTLAIVGTSVDLSPAAVSNFANGTLSGGAWDVGQGGTLTLGVAHGTTAFVDDATIILDGAGSTVNLVDTLTKGVATLESKLAAIGPGGTLAVLGGRDFHSFRVVTNDGAVRLGGGTFTASGLTLGAAGTLSGFGTADAKLYNQGIVEATGGTLALLAPVRGPGALIVDDGAALRIGAAVGGAVTLDGASQLVLADFPAFRDTINGLSAGDTIGFAGADVTAARLTANALRITLADGTTDLFRVGTHDAGLQVTLASDGAGGTTLSFG